jgi:hypothetical protein
LPQELVVEPRSYPSRKALLLEETRLARMPLDSLCPAVREDPFPPRRGR